MDLFVTLNVGTFKNILCILIVCKYVCMFHEFWGTQYNVPTVPWVAMICF
jgi:hypothetical protein